MTPTQDMSILSLVLNAGAVVQGIMLLLLIVSFMSWYYIFLKWMTIRSEKQKSSEFESSFWSGSSLNDLYQAALNDRHNAGALERIFESGLREFNKLRDQQLLEPTREAPGDVRVNEHRVQRDEHEVGVERCRFEAKQEQRHERQAPRHDHIDDVQARAGQPVHAAARVVHRVEGPQPAYSMKQAVHRVLHDIGDHCAGEALQHEGHRAHELLHVGIHRPSEDHGGGHQRQQGHALHQ